MPSTEFRVMVTGHRPNKLGGYGASPTQQRVRAWLREQLNTYRARRYDLIAISGMALGVDQWFAWEANGLGIPFDAYVPCDGQDSLWPTTSRTSYRELLWRARTVVQVSPGPFTPEKMQRRNEAMVQAAHAHLAVWNGSRGGTMNCIKYMRSIGVEPTIFNPKEQ